MSIRCPAHGFRDLGRLRWLPSALPLRTDDVCRCSSSPVRDFLEGRRGPLTEAELNGAEHNWEKTYGPESNDAWLFERRCIDYLLRQYEQEKGKQGRQRG